MTAPVSPVALPAATDTVVIGSGFAGMSAAVRLATAGRRVLVVEEAPRLGGRATSFVDRQTGERVDNGQHAIFGCYRETYEFLAEVGAAHMAPLQERLTLTMADEGGRIATLTCSRLPPPWHLLAGLLRWRGVGLPDRASALRLAGLLRRAGIEGPAAVAGQVASDLTVASWLAARGQSKAICDWLWYPLAIAALNQSPRVAAAAPFVRVLCELFAPDPTAASISLPLVPLDDLFAAPAVAYLSARNGMVAAGTRASVLANEGTVTGVRVGEAVVASPVVISAVPWHAFARLWEPVPAPLLKLASRAAELGSSPIVTANLWLDPPPALPAPFVGLVRGPMHWVFDKSRLFRDRPGHLSIVASGADDLASMDGDAIINRAVETLRQTFPAMAGCRVRHSVVVRERRATFSLAPGGPARPGPVTAVRGFYVAGDWTDTGLPGTIEGAVRSGHAAAAAAMRHAGS